MYELIKTGCQSYYVNSPAKIGIFKQNDTDIYLIDSGNDKEAGRRIRKILDEKGWTLKGIINTHSNADHIGGNKYLQNQTGCKIFAKGIEAAFTNHPILEPSFLYGGYPCKDLRHKFLLADKSNAVDISDHDFPDELQIIDLKGHFFDMIGIRTPDDTVFLADCISSRETLEKYQLSFIYDVQEYLNTLDKIEKLQARMFVPAHAQATNNISELVQFNRQRVFDIADKLCSDLTHGMCFESLLKKIFDDYALTMNFEQYVLIGSTVKSYLSYLKDNGKITVQFKDNQLLWKKA